MGQLGFEPPPPTTTCTPTPRPPPTRVFFGRRKKKRDEEERKEEEGRRRKRRNKQVLAFYFAFATILNVEVDVDLAPIKSINQLHTHSIGRSCTYVPGDSRLM